MDNSSYFFKLQTFLFPKMDWKLLPHQGGDCRSPTMDQAFELAFVLLNENNIFKIISAIGVSLAMDFLTAYKSCITFTSICVQIKPDFLLLDEIHINLNGYKVKQQMVYDWKL